MSRVDLQSAGHKAKRLKELGGGSADIGKMIERLCAQIHALELELQESRQLKLFGDVNQTPRKTPIGT